MIFSKHYLFQERADVAEKQLENKIKDLENKNKKLFDEKCRYELQNRELIAKVGFSSNMT